MRILLTGAGGVVGREVGRLLAERAPGAEIARVTRTTGPAGDIAWRLGVEPPPPTLRGAWDVVIHTAASTRWTMTRDEAISANVLPTQAAVDLVGPKGHLVHVSTAYVDGVEPDSTLTRGGFDHNRNGYEWSKRECEQLIRRCHAGALTIIRPPLIIGRETDGAITRFSGPYTLLQSLVSGLAAAVIGDPEGYAEIAPVDQVAGAVVDAALGAPPTEPVVDTLAAGPRCMRLGDLVSVACETISAWRSERGLAPITPPPFIPAERWHRFFLPLAREHLSEIQLQAIELMGMFESYTSMSAPFQPTTQVTDPVAVLVRSIRFWADRKPRLASRTPESWALVGVGG